MNESIVLLNGLRLEQSKAKEYIGVGIEIMMIKHLIEKLNKLDPGAEVFNCIGDCLSPNVDLSEKHDVYEISSGHGLFALIDYDDNTLCEYVEEMKGKIRIKRKVYIL